MEHRILEPAGTADGLQALVAQLLTEILLYTFLVVTDKIRPSKSHWMNRNGRHTAFYPYDQPSSLSHEAVRDVTLQISLHVIILWWHDCYDVILFNVIRMWVKMGIVEQHNKPIIGQNVQVPIYNQDSSDFDAVILKGHNWTLHSLSIL